ncbi:hypothetical protein YC2023_095101 [Brassica napus]
MVLIGQKTPVAKWMLSKGHTRSISRRLFARMIALYAHHDLQDKVIDVIQLSFVLIGNFDPNNFSRAKYDPNK